MTWPMVRWFDRAERARGAATISSDFTNGPGLSGQRPADFVAPDPVNAGCSRFATQRRAIIERSGVWPNRYPRAARGRCGASQHPSSPVKQTQEKQGGLSWHRGAWALTLTPFPLRVASSNLSDWSVVRRPAPKSLPPCPRALVHVPTLPALQLSRLCVPRLPERQTQLSCARAAPRLRAASPRQPCRCTPHFVLNFSSAVAAGLGQFLPQPPPRPPPSPGAPASAQLAPAPAGGVPVPLRFSANRGVRGAVAATAVGSPLPVDASLL